LRNLNERQVKAVLYTKENGEITNSIYQNINSLKRSTAAEELQDLTERKLLEKIGTTGRGTKYIVRGFRKTSGKHPKRPVNDW
jgi:ATP-dependent DNA helicase RecG